MIPAPIMIVSEDMLFGRAYRCLYIKVRCNVILIRGPDSFTEGGTSLKREEPSYISSFLDISSPILFLHKEV